MPTPVGTMLVQIHWTIVPGEEEAIITHHLEAPVSPFDLDDVAEQQFGLLGDNYGDLQAFMQAQSVLDKVTVYRLDAAGHATASGVFIDPTTLNGGSSTNNLPLEVACCVNEYAFDPTHTVANRGRKRGRVYLPAPTVSVMTGSDGNFNNGYLDAVIAFWGGYCNDSIVAGVPNAILSKRDGATYVVEQLRVDSVPDVIRSRRRQQVPIATQTFALTP